MQNNINIVHGNTQTPVLCTRYDDFDIYFEGYGWELPRTDMMMDGLENSRYADICGEDIAAMDGLGWEFIADPICFTATHQDSTVIASGWAAPMLTEDGQTGCNLTYAVDEKYEGRSLAKLLTSLAFLAADQVHPQMKFANIECRVDNQPSIALARSLGLISYPEGDFSMPVSGTGEEVAFHCFRADIEEFRHSARHTLQKKNLGELLVRATTSSRPGS